jgi:CubicO group peptidase (beta-lactamase class C family)
MTTDQLTDDQKAASAFLPGAFDNVGWGFGVSMQTRRVDPYGPVGRFGWDGGLGTTFSVDPTEGMVTMLFTQRGWSSPQPPPVATDFWTSAYAAIDD